MIWTPNYRGCPRAHVLLADPPWHFRDRMPGARGASRKYRTLTVPEIMRYPLPPLHEDAILLLWRVAALQRAALDVAYAWGFQEKAEIVWLKETKNGKRHYGQGHYVRNEHEVCLVCVRGRASSRVVVDASQRSTFRAPAATAQHYSRKPDAFYELAERLACGPRVELFATRRRRGWRCYGEELST